MGFSIQTFIWIFKYFLTAGYPGRQRRNCQDHARPVGPSHRWLGHKVGLQPIFWEKYLSSQGGESWGEGCEASSTTPESHGSWSWRWLISIKQSRPWFLFSFQLHAKPEPRSSRLRENRKVKYLMSSKIITNIFAASKALKEASDIISSSSSALQLRWVMRWSSLFQNADPTNLCLARYLQTLSQIAAERNSTIVFPLPIELMGQLMPKQGQATNM